MHKLVEAFDEAYDLWQAFTKELLVWSGLKPHPGIARFIGFYADFERSEAWLLSPWEPHGNVTDFISGHQLEVPEKLSLVDLTHFYYRKATYCVFLEGL